MELLNKEFPAAVCWSLETPADKMQNHHLYKKLGYEVTKEYMVGNVKISLFQRHILKKIKMETNDMKKTVLR